MDVDKTGVSMSWKTALSMGGVIVMGAVAWTVFTAGLATKADAEFHNVSPLSHPVDLDNDVSTPPVPLPQVSKVRVKKDIEQDKRLAEVEAKTGDNKNIIVTVQNGFYEQRADTLAYKRVKQLPSAMPYQRKKAEFDRVKKRAIKNQKSKKDINDGLEGLAF